MSVRTMRLVTIFLSLSVTTVASWAQESQLERARALYDEAYELVLSEEWDRAMQRFGDLSDSPAAGELMDDAKFWQCYAIEKHGISAERAYRCYEELRTRFAGSEWSDDAASAMVRLARELADAGHTQYRAAVEALQQDGSTDVAVTAIYALAEPGDNSVIPALERMVERNSAPPVRRAVVHALHKVGTEEAQDLLVEIIRSDTDPRVQSEAVHALGSLEASGADQILIELLGTSDDPAVRRASVQALHQLRTPAAARALARHLERETDPSVLRESIFAAAGAGGPDALPAIGNVLRKSDVLDVKIAAVQNLRRFDSAEARRELVRVLRESPEPRLRREAAMALAIPEQNDGVEILAEAALNDSDAEVRKVAAQALGQIGTRESRAALQEVLVKSTDLQ